jgi:hypothetical protein
VERVCLWFKTNLNELCEFKLFSTNFISI